MFGENGPELGFFPLQRGSDGRLGVAAHGAGGGGMVNNTTVNVEVRADDPNAFRKSQGQILSDARRSAGLRR
jgi:phage-related minor tail protein